MNDDLLPLPPQPEGVPWPTPGPDGWPVGTGGDEVEALVTALFDDPEGHGDTYAVVVVKGGRLCHERYGGALPHFDRPPEPVDAGTRLLSWSMAKSMLHSVVGMLVAEGRLEPAAPAPVAEWHRSDDDPRSAITLQDLLEMRDGLAWNEDYSDAGASDVIEMLFGAGQHDCAAYAIDRPAAHRPGDTFNYSSGTSNIVARIVGEALGGESAMRAFLHERLFDPIGMTSVDARFDEAGTFLGSSYVYATARDFARYGLLALRGGEWDGQQVLPDGWVDHGRTFRSTDSEKGEGYGAHWWVEGDAHGTFRAQGYEGQSTLVCPAKDAVVVRLGRTLEHQKPLMIDWRHDVIEALNPNVEAV